MFKALLLLLNQKFTCIDTVWAKLYNRSFLNNNNIVFNSKLQNGEDILFNYECYTKTDKIYFCNEYSYVYRTNPFSVCQTYFDDLDKRIIILLNEFNFFLQKNQIDEPLFNEFAFRVVCRLFRKYYNYCSSYEIFSEKIENLFNNDIVIKCLNELNDENLLKDKKLLLKELKCQNKINFYNMSKCSHEMNLK